MNTVTLLTAAFAILTRIAKSADLQKTDTYIVGGHNSTPGEVPYQLGLYFNGEHFCGASLVELNGYQFAISAAHCTSDQEPEGVTVKAGILNLNEENGQTRQVVKIVNHPNHSPVAHPFDISLLFFNNSFELNNNVQTISLPLQDQVIADGTLTVSGWGKLAYNGNFSENLQVVSMPVVNDTACRAAYANYFFHPDDTMICAGDSTGNVYPCQGDSGGPGAKSGVLAAIVSWGFECGHPAYPAVFAKVGAFVDWINSTVSNHKLTYMLTDNPC